LDNFDEQLCNFTFPKSCTGAALKDLQIVDFNPEEAGTFIIERIISIKVYNVQPLQNYCFLILDKDLKSLSIIPPCPLASISW
jgi:hypothetical protein